MNSPKQKVKLSRKLMLGVGRNSGRGSFLPHITLIFLVISAVLGIRAGYLVFSHSSPQSKPEPQVLGAQDTPQEEKSFRDYKVKAGDTLFSIAQSNKLEWTTLATINNLKAPFTLKQGQVLQIPQ